MSQGPPEAPLCVPVELRRLGAEEEHAPRWFRLAVAIAASPPRLRLRSALPEELREGPVAARLHLPLELDQPPPPLQLVGVGAEVVVDEGHESERAEVRLLSLRGLGDKERALIEGYVAQRLLPAAP